MPIETYEVGKIVDIQARDGDVNAEEGELWADLQKAGVLGRWGTNVLSTAFNEVRDVDLPADKKLPGLEVIGRCMKAEARGIHKHFWDVPYDLLDQISTRTQIRDDEALLEAGRTKQGRHDLADRVWGDLDGITRLVQMADLQRVNGIGPMLSSVLHQSGIESIPALAAADAREVEAAFNRYAASLTGRAVHFRVPPRYRIQEYIDAAAAMEPAVEYNSVLEGKSIEERARILLDGHPALDGEYAAADIASWARGDRAQYREMLLTNQQEFLEEAVGLLNNYADRIPEWHDADGNVVHPDPLTVDHLMAGYEVPYLDNEGYDVNAEPVVTDYTEDGEYRGTVLEWEVRAYCEDSYFESIKVSLVFDAEENRIVARDYQVCEEYDDDGPTVRRFELID